MADIRHLLRIAVSPQKIYHALTSATEIRGWWTINADLDQYVGGKGIFRFDYGQTVETIVDVINLQENLMVSWAVTDSFRPEQVGTIITFKLRPDGEGCQVLFCQDGFPRVDDTYALMNTGWAYYLVSLKYYLERGKGGPSPYVDFSILIK